MNLSRRMEFWNGKSDIKGLLIFDVIMPYQSFKRPYVSPMYCKRRLKDRAIFFFLPDPKDSKISELTNIFWGSFPGRG